MMRQYHCAPAQGGFRGNDALLAIVILQRVKVVKRYRFCSHGRSINKTTETVEQ
jgi:hypothetical protein